MLNDSSKDSKLAEVVPSVEQPAPAANTDVTTQPTHWPWNPLMATIIAVGLFLASQFISFVTVYGSMTIYARFQGVDSSFVDGWLDSTLAQFVTIGIAELLVVVGVVWLFRHNKLSLRDLGFGRWPKLNDAMLAPMFFAVYYGLLVAVLAILTLVAKGLISGQQQEIGFDDATSVGQLSLVFLALVVCAPVAEEVLFRGFLFANLRKRWSFWGATLATSLLFGGAHLAGGSGGLMEPLWTAGIDTFLLSLALCYLREKTGSLWASIFLHMIKNGVAFLFLFVLHSSA